MRSTRKENFYDYLETNAKNGGYTFRNSILYRGEDSHIQCLKISVSKAHDYDDFVKILSQEKIRI